MACWPAHATSSLGLAAGPPLEGLQPQQSRPSGSRDPRRPRLSAALGPVTTSAGAGGAQLGGRPLRPGRVERLAARGPRGRSPGQAGGARQPAVARLARSHGRGPRETASRSPSSFLRAWWSAPERGVHCLTPTIHTCSVGVVFGRGSPSRPRRGSPPTQRSLARLGQPWDPRPALDDSAGSCHLRVRKWRKVRKILFANDLVACPGQGLIDAFAEDFQSHLLTNLTKKGPN